MFPVVPLAIASGKEFRTIESLDWTRPLCIQTLLGGWEALLKELAWDGTFTQKRVWPRTSSVPCTG